MDDEDSRRAVEKHPVYRPQHSTPVHKKAKKTEFVEKVKYLGSAESNLSSSDSEASESPFEKTLEE